MRFRKTAFTLNRVCLGWGKASVSATVMGRSVREAVWHLEGPGSTHGARLLSFQAPSKNPAQDLAGVHCTHLPRPGYRLNNHKNPHGTSAEHCYPEGQCQELGFSLTWAAQRVRAEAQLPCSAGFSQLRKAFSIPVFHLQVLSWSLGSWRSTESARTPACPGLATWTLAPASWPPWQLPCSSGTFFTGERTAWHPEWLSSAAPWQLGFAVGWTMTMWSHHADECQGGALPRTLLVSTVMEQSRNQGTACMEAVIPFVSSICICTIHRYVYYVYINIWSYIVCASLPWPTHNLASRSHTLQGDRPRCTWGAQWPCSAPWSGVNLFCACSDGHLQPPFLQ